MDIILRAFFVYFFVAALAQGGVIHSKSISNASQFVFEGSSSGYIITAGGLNGNRLSNVYALNLGSGEWTGLPSLPYPAYYFNLVLSDSTVYAVGGCNTVQGCNNKTLILSTKDNIWKIESDLVFSLGQLLSASLNGSIYAVGGTWGHTLQAMGCNGTWKQLAPSIYSHDVIDDAIAVLNDRLYVLGCHHHDEVYDPSTDTWTAINMTNQERCGARIVALNGYIYVIGGANTKNERYDPATGDFTYFEACLYTPVFYAGVVTDGEKIYVVGGWIEGEDSNKVQVYRPEGAASNKVQVYRPDLDLWQSMSDYPVKVYLLGAVYVKELPTD